MTRKMVRRQMTSLAVATCLAACGGGGSVSVTVSPSTTSLTGSGQTATLTATVKVDNEIDASASVAWSSSNTAVSTVSPGGLAATVTSVAPGTAIITATSRGKTATSSVTVVAAPTPAVVLSAAPLTVAQGASGTIGITVIRTAFTAPVTLTLEGAPAGVTGTFGPPQTSGNAESQALTVTAVASAPVGQHTLTVRATGQGVATATATFVLTVNEATYAMSLSTTSFTVEQGGASISGVLRLARTNFPQTVQLTALGAPTGLTIGISPTSVTADSATVTVTAAAAVAAGTYPITVTGTSTPFTPRTVSFSVVVQPSASRTVTWNFCGASGIPDWVAIQDGPGFWTQVITTTPNVYSFPLVSGRGGVSYVFHIGLLAVESTFFGTTDEIIAHGNELCVGVNGFGTFHNVGVAGASPTDAVQGAMGRAIGLFNLSGSPSAQFLGVQGTAPGATTDLLAARSTFSIVGGLLTSTLQDVIIRRGIPIGVTPASINFASAEPFVPSRHTLAIQNLGNDLAYLFGSYQTANNAYGNYFANALQLAANTLEFPAIPAQRQQPGDRHVLRLSSRPVGDSLQTRYVYDVFKDAVSHTSTFGPTLSTPAIVALQTGSTVGFSFTLPVQQQYNRFFTASASQQSASLFHSVQQTAAYAALGASVQLSLPDLSRVAGFDPAWALKTGVETWWNVSASRWTGGGPVSPPYDFINTPPYESGITYYAASRQGKITP